MGKFGFNHLSWVYQEKRWREFIVQIDTWIVFSVMHVWERRINEDNDFFHTGETDVGSYLES